MCVYDQYIPILKTYILFTPMYYMNLIHIISTLLDMWLHEQNKYNMINVYIILYTFV